MSTRPNQDIHNEDHTGTDAADIDDNNVRTFFLCQTLSLPLWSSFLISSIVSRGLIGFLFNAFFHRFLDCHRCVLVVAVCICPFFSLCTVFWFVWFCCRLTVSSQYVLALQRCLYPRPVWSTWRPNAGRMTKRSGRFCRPSRSNSVCLIPVCQCHCVQKSADMYRLCKRTETDDHILKHIKSRASLLRSKQLYLLLLWIEMFFLCRLHRPYWYTLAARSSTFC